MIKLSDQFMANLHSIEVTLIGCGGTGSKILRHISALSYVMEKLGRKPLTIRIIDGDKVSNSNIGRQQFPEPYIGEYKVNALSEMINSFYGCIIEAIPEYYKNTYNYLNTSDIVISCVDNVKTRYEIAKDLKSLCKTQQGNIIWFDFGNGRDYGQFIIGNNNDAPYPTDAISFVEKPDNGPSCSLEEALTEQDLYINEMLACHGGNALYKLCIFGSLSYRGMYINLKSNKFNEIPYEQNDNRKNRRSTRSASSKHGATKKA